MVEVYPSAFTAGVQYEYMYVTQNAYAQPNYDLGYFPTAENFNNDMSLFWLA